jgi:hypothetical protein
VKCVQDLTMMHASDVLVDAEQADEREGGSRITESLNKLIGARIAECYPSQPRFPEQTFKEKQCLDDRDYHEAD